MAKPNTGYVFKDKYNRWFARTSYVDTTGKRRNVKKCARDRAHAKEVLKKLLRDLEDNGPKYVETAAMTFAELADYYTKTYLIEPEYVNDRKVAGLRSWYDIKFRLIVIREFFDRYKIRDITHKNIEGFKLHRLRRLGEEERHKRQTLREEDGQEWRSILCPEAYKW
jgi:hypothetical protein